MDAGKCEYMKGKPCPYGIFHERDSECTKCMLPIFHKLDDLNRNLSIIAQRL